MLDFCLGPKKWEIQFFFEIGSRLDTAPGALLNRAPLKLRVLIKLVSLAEVESRTQGSRPRPRTQKKIQGQGQPFRRQTLSRPRPRTKDTSASALQKKKGFHKNFSGDLQKKKKRSSQKFFKRSPLQNVFQKIFQALHKILTFQKIVLSSSRGQAIFEDLRPRTSKSVLEDSTSDH